MYFPAWLDAAHRQPGHCFECEDEKRRAEAAAQRRAEQATSTTQGDV